MLLLEMAEGWGGGPPYYPRDSPKQEEMNSRSRTVVEGLCRGEDLGGVVRDSGKEHKSLYYCHCHGTSSSFRLRTLWELSVQRRV